ncbi:MAG TPA: hypothetical protein VGK73_26985, partial [Polyangiaceae bacterium]
MADSRQQALTVVLPVRSGEGAALERVLEERRETVLAKLRGVGSLHFGRFVVVPARERHQGGPDESAKALLLFESSFDGSYEAHATELRRELGGELDGMISHCEGGGSAFEAPFRAGARRAAAFFSAHPRLSVAEIRDDAQLRARFSHFLRQERAALVSKAPREIVETARAALGVSHTDTAPLGAGLGGARRAPLLELVGLLPLLARATLNDLSDFFHALWTDRKLAVGLQDRFEGDAGNGGGQRALTHVVELKPGRFRRRALAAALRFVDARFRAAQAPFGSSHFARWVDLGDGRLAFLCHHDGSLEAELGTFVERLATLVTFVWSNTRDFPASFGPLFGGARDEACFKHWAR